MDTGKCNPVEDGIITADEGAALRKGERKRLHLHPHATGRHLYDPDWAITSILAPRSAGVDCPARSRRHVISAHTGVAATAATARRGGRHPVSEPRRRTTERQRVPMKVAARGRAGMGGHPHGHPPVPSTERGPRAEADAPGYPALTQKRQALPSVAALPNPTPAGTCLATRSDRAIRRAPHPPGSDGWPAALARSPRQGSRPPPAKR
jgi:hypothetical protein